MGAVPLSVGAREPVVAEGEIAERLDQAVLLLTAGVDALAQHAQCNRVRVRIGERRFCRCELKRDRRVQLVHNARGEAIRPVETFPASPIVGCGGAPEFKAKSVGDEDRSMLGRGRAWQGDAIRPPSPHLCPANSVPATDPQRPAVGESRSLASAADTTRRVRAGMLSRGALWLRLFASSSLTGVIGAPDRCRL